MIALYEAYYTLQSGDYTSIIIIKTNLIIGLIITAAIIEEGILFLENSCKTFNITINGFTRSTTIKIIHIKRLDNIIKNKNLIRAVIRNTKINSDKKS